MTKPLTKTQSKLQAFWKDIPQMIAKDDVVSWLRPYVLRSSVAYKKSPRPTAIFFDEVEKLSEEDRLSFIMILVVAHDKHSSLSDFYGAVGIPLFISIFALIEISDLSDIGFLIYALPLLIYIFMYYYSRTLTALLSSCIEGLDWKYDKLRH